MMSTVPKRVFGTQWGYGEGNPNGEVAYNAANIDGNVKSLSGRYLSWLNGNLSTQNALNASNQDLTFYEGAKRVAQFAGRLFAGVLTIPIGLVGFLWHAGSAIASTFTKDGHAMDHLGSMIVDIYRMTGLGAIGYAISPDTYLASGEGRVDENGALEPVIIEGDIINYDLQ